MAWLIDGNKLKEKAVTLLFPTRMEPNGGLATEAVTVGEIEGMLYREGRGVQSSFLFAKAQSRSIATRRQARA